MFDEDDQEGEQGHGFKVNKNFERRFNERKKREDLEWAQSKYGSNFEQMEDEASPSSLEDDENARLDSDEVTMKLFSTISKIRQKKPEIYENNKRFFSEQDLGNSTKLHELGKRKQQPLTYKKLVRDRVMAGEMNEEDEESEVEETPFNVQQRLKNEFKQVADKEGSEKEDDDNLFTIKKKTKQQVLDEEEEFDKFVKNQKKRDKDDAKDIQQIWGSANILNEDDKFLRKFILTKAWMEKSDDDYSDEGRKQNFTHVADKKDAYSAWQKGQKVADEEDEARSEEVDEYEEKINFRYEQPGGSRLQTYERNNPDSMRIQDNKRAEKRKEREGRKIEEKVNFKNEVDHIKLLKKEQIDKKISKLMEAGGLSRISSEKTLNTLMAQDFDDQQFDTQMNNIYNDEYYEDEDEDEDKLKKYVEEVEDDVDQIIGGGEKLKEEIDNSKPVAAMDPDDVVLKPSSNVHITMKKKINKEEAEVLKSALNDPLWWYCDQCGRGIQPLEARFDCMECDDYTECKQCAELKGHEHQMKKFMVPEGMRRMI